MTRATTVLLTALGLIFGEPVQAATMKYTLTETGVLGKLGSTDFSNAEMTITVIGDTTTITQPNSNACTLVGIGSATITISGLGTFESTNPFRVTSSGSATTARFLAISDSVTRRSLFQIRNSKAFGFPTDYFTGYDLSTPIGPVSVFSSYPLNDPPTTLNPISTSGGDLLIYILETRGATFSAAEVPEPATLSLLGIGVAGMFGYTWRRRQASASLRRFES